MLLTAATRSMRGDPMTKAKATKGSGGATARQSPSKVRPSSTATGKVATTGAKAAPKKPAAPVKPAAKAPAKPAAKAAPKAPAKPMVKAAPVEVPVAVVAEAPAPTGTEGLRVKKKVKRGAPPMLPRRMARRPPAPGTVAPGSTPPPPPKPTAPGSLHTPARSPEGAEQLKTRIIAVKNELGRVKALKRNINKTFWEVGEIFLRLSEPALFQAIGYGSWESFIEREVERDLGIGRTLADDLRRIVKVYQREIADELGLERLRGGLRALYPEPGGHPAGSTTGLPSGA